MRSDSIGTGWVFPPRAQAHGAIAVNSGVERVEQAMRIILLTYPGERQMRPDFGSRLRDFVFAEMSVDTAGRIATEVRAALTRWEGRVQVREVFVEPAVDEAAGLFRIDIRYRLAGEPDRSVVLDFDSLVENTGVEGSGVR
ncbi:GPW/gp25 family protein [Actinocatenispora sera]|uniref:IraD/Gp25-like domain-containing protein n=1 Tax=Actinocatenispora sera TaxID=390989 RepID=A0A810L8N6_9ACTN|nr:GPW/gp25 family protein [Actinocatenispora sera]BCJ31894.1 hypothetical protein Asera_60020 [Actinocatenispora sera]